MRGQTASRDSQIMSSSRAAEQTDQTVQAVQAHGSMTDISVVTDSHSHINDTDANETIALIDH